MTIYKYDLHTHTSEVSLCGKVNAPEVVDLYKKAGYTGIVITDHYYKRYFDNIDSPNWGEKIDYYLEGYKKASNEGLRVGLNVILGMEINFIDGPEDFLVYGISEQFLRENPELYYLGLRKFRKLIKDRGMLIYQAHPFRPGQSVQNLELLDGIEVYNGNPRQNSKNDIAYSFALKNSIRMISGSDFHQVQDLATRGGITVKEIITNLEELVEALKNNDVVELIMDS